MIDRLFPQLSHNMWTEVNLDDLAQIAFPDGENPLLNPDICQAWIRDLSDYLQATYSYGGLFEDRSHLWRESYLKPERSIHLGIDFNVPENTAVFPLYSGVVMEVFVDDEKWGWGGRVVVAQGNYRIIYAHLDPDTIQVKEGDYMKGGKIIGLVGSSEVNGWWYPHLHLQPFIGDVPSDGYGSIDDVYEWDKMFPEGVL